MDNLPLSSVRVLDVTQNVAGPFCTQILADLGADVIKVEPPEGDGTRTWGPPFWKSQSTMFMAFNRNKRSLALNVKAEEGRAILNRLLEQASILVVALRPSTAKRLQLDPESVKVAFPTLLVCELTAFGPTGPLADEPGFDPLIQSFSGLLSIMGSEGAPCARVATSIMDMGAGMWAALGIVSALLQRRSGSHGPSSVQTSLFETALAWMPYQILGFLATGETPRRLGTELPMIAPYGAYATADRDIMIAVGSEKLWKAFCRALDRPDLPEDERFSSNPRRVTQRAELRTALEEELRRKGADDWVTILTDFGVPAAPVNSIPEALDHPQTAEVGMLQYETLKDLPLIGLPLTFDQDRPRPREKPPTLGEHTEEILLHQLGLGPEDVRRLESQGVIRTRSFNEQTA